jgi:hypothetical protein
MSYVDDEELKIGDLNDDDDLDLNDDLSGPLDDDLLADDEEDDLEGLADIHGAQY